LRLIANTLYGLVMLGTDPLKIYYLVVLGTDKPEEVTAFQGFSTSWKYLHWALHLLATLPADVLEKTYKIEDVIAQRMGDGRPLFWLPVNIGALEQLKTEDIGPFIVCFSGEEDAALRVSAWVEDQPYPVLHVSTVNAPSACHIDEFDHGRLHRYCLEAFEARFASLTPDRQETARTGLGKWADPIPVPSGIKKMLHNILLPNHMSLLRSARSLEKGEPFIGKSEAEYTTVILESMAAIFRVRDEIGIRPLHAMTLLNPAIILAEPALLRSAYRRMKLKGQFEKKAFAKTLRFLQSQKGLHNEIDIEYLKDLRQSRAAQILVMERQSELETLTLGAGLKAAQTCSAVMRLSPGVNHVFSDLSAYARHMRSHKIEARLKTSRLFEAIQKGLKEAVGDERIAFVKQQGGPLKILSDAPVEWLPIGNLPLCLRYDCSRINVTPGNLMMAQLTNSAALTFQPADLRKILVVSSFSEDDPLRNVLTGSLDVVRHQSEGKVELVFASVVNQEEFARALNSFDGYIMIFDGHGADNADEPVGKIVFGKDAVDVWQMRGAVRIPPIVVLSACDTHGIDALSHATVGNGFLALGARTVLATLLPVDGFASGAMLETG
jgi:CHAT domain-containing protein